MVVETITKRDGKRVPFDSEKIRAAAAKAFIADGMTPEEAYNASQRVSDRVIGSIDNTFRKTIPTVEQIQDLVEDSMMGLGKKYHGAAKRYVIYRKEHEKGRELDAAGKNVFSFARRLFNGYVGGADWRGDRKSVV